MTIARPALRYHGGKWVLAPWIIQHFSPHRTYVEPFGGAASVLLRKEQSYAEVYSDLDGEVVNLFRVLRDRVVALELERLLRLTPFARDEFTGAYEPTEEPVESARRLLIRSFMGFGSDGCQAKATGFRANSNRSGTTPAHDWANWPDVIAGICDRLQGVVIENRPAAEIIAQHDTPETLHYIDPPYLHSTRESAKRYRHEMTDDEHIELSRILHSVTGMVVLSGYHSELYDQEYRTWDRVECSALADGARPRTEVLWLNHKAMEGQPNIKLPFPIDDKVNTGVG